MACFTLEVFLLVLAWYSIDAIHQVVASRGQRLILRLSGLDLSLLSLAGLPLAECAVLEEPKTEVIAKELYRLPAYLARESIVQLLLDSQPKPKHKALKFFGALVALNNCATFVVRMLSFSRLFATIVTTI